MKTTYAKIKLKVKALVFGKCPGLRGRFPYFGSWVYFPKGSLAFTEACRQGIFELENLQLLMFLTRSQTYMFDVGSNIGLMSVPVLYHNRACKVLSFEPSPNSAPWIEKTISNSCYKNRWELIKKAAGAEAGTIEFCVSNITDAVYDSIVNTKRSAGSRTTLVGVTTLDLEWKNRGCPEVSMIKIDVEGWEAKVLEGAKELILSQKPHILLEWQRTNLEAAGIATSLLLKIAGEFNYQVFRAPELIEVFSPDSLEINMIKTETFLLSPRH